MQKRLSPFNVVSIALGLAFLYLPITILVIYSFNYSRLVTVWGGWSTRWYVALLNDSAMLEAASGSRRSRRHSQPCSARLPRWRWCGPGGSAAGPRSRPWSTRRW
jgi:hypothetical protein